MRKSAFALFKFSKHSAEYSQQFKNLCELKKIVEYILNFFKSI